MAKHGVGHGPHPQLSSPWNIIEHLKLKQHHAQLPVKIFCDEGKEGRNVYYMQLYKTKLIHLFDSDLQLWFNRVQGNVLD